MFRTLTDQAAFIEDHPHGLVLSGYTHKAGHNQHDAMLGTAFIPGAFGDKPLETVLSRLNEKLAAETVFGTETNQYVTSSTLIAAHLGKDGKLTIGWAGDSPAVLHVRHPSTGEIASLKIGFEPDEGFGGITNHIDAGRACDFKFSTVDLPEIISNRAKEWGIDSKDIPFSVAVMSDGVSDQIYAPLFAHSLIGALPSGATGVPASVVSEYNKESFIAHGDVASKTPAIHHGIRTAQGNYDFGSKGFKSGVDNITAVSTNFMTLDDLAHSDRDCLMVVCDGVSTPPKGYKRKNGQCEISEYVVKTLDEIVHDKVCEPDHHSEPTYHIPLQEWVDKQQTAVDAAKKAFEEIKTPNLGKHEADLPAGTIISFRDTFRGMIVGWKDHPTVAGKRQAVIIYPDKDDIHAWDNRTIEQRKVKKVEADGLDAEIVKKLYGKFIQYHEENPEYAGQISDETRKKIVETHKKLNSDQPDDGVIATGKKKEKDSDKDLEHKHDKFLETVAMRAMRIRLGEIYKTQLPTETIYQIQFKASKDDEDGAKATIREKLSHIGIPDDLIKGIFDPENNLSAFENDDGNYSFYFSNPAHILIPDELEQFGISAFKLDPKQLQDEEIESYTEYNKLYRGWLHKHGTECAGYSKLPHLNSIAIDGSNSRFNLNEYITGVDASIIKTTGKARVVTTIASGEGNDYRESKLSFTDEEVKSSTSHPEAMAGMISILNAAEWESISLEAKSHESLVNAATAVIANNMVLDDETQNKVLDAYNALDAKKAEKDRKPAQNYKQVHDILKSTKPGGMPKPPSLNL